MINESNGKIIVEAKEDKRLEVAIELAKTVNNLSEMLKNMETTISNIHINACNIQTAQGETALYIGNNVKDAMISNSVFQSDYSHSTPKDFYGDEDEDEEEYECCGVGEPTEEPEESTVRAVKRNAEVGEKIKVTEEVDTGWRKTTYPLNSIHIVREKFANDTTVTPHDFSEGLVACEGNQFLIDSSRYVVLEEGGEQ